MNDSKHWLEDGGPAEFERLLSAARHETPRSGGAERALVAAGIVGAGALVSETATAGGVVGKSLLGGMMKWFAVGVIGAGTVVVTAQVVVPDGPDAREASRSVELSRRTHASHAQRAPNAPPQGVPASRSTETAAPLPAATVPPEPATSPTAAKGSEHGGDARVPAPAVADPDRTFAEELGLVDAARTRLRAGDASGALRSAGEYNRRFPAGRFAPEALYLLMQARLELGQRKAAEDLAREILRRFPNAAQVARAREVLGSEEEPKKP
jgi:hypothetical protein